MSIRVLTKKDGDFYLVMGPYLANRKIEKAIGYQLYDDDDKTWFVKIKNGEVVGFCYLWQKKHTADIGSFYVIPSSNESVIRELMMAAVNYAESKITLTTHNKSIFAVCMELGFRLKGERGIYKVFTKNKESK